MNQLIVRPLQGRLDNVHCALDAPLTGRVRVEECEAKIRSVEVQLIRVETIQVRLLFVSKTHYIEDFHLQNENERATSEVQNIQVADGDVPRKWDLPIRIMLPR